MISLLAFIAVAVFIVGYCEFGIRHDAREDAKRTAQDAKSMQRHARAINTRIGRDMDGCEELFTEREF